MYHVKEEVVIVGGGLAGLTAAYLLKQEGLNPLVLESIDRIGGRIFTKNLGKQSYELGATWVFQDQLLKQLISTLELSLYPQYLNGDALVKYDPSMSIKRNPTEALMNGAIYHKVKGGTGAIIKALSHQLDESRILLDKRVVAINYPGEDITLSIEDGSMITANKVIMAIPPKVISGQIKITPSIDHQQVMESTHTWMGDSTKFTVLFDQDYWRMNNLSGFVYSNYGLIREIQDHSNDESFGLLGFMQPMGELAMNFEKRKELVIRELNELFGIRSENILGYDDFLWVNHFVDDHQTNYNEGMIPHQNNGHHLLRTPLHDGKLIMGGSETAQCFPGYMDGAIEVSKQIAQQVIERLKA